MVGISLVVCRPFFGRGHTLITCLFLLVAPPVFAQYLVPLPVCSLTPTLNEFGDRLPGNFYSAPGQRALVQILRAPDGAKYPPQTGPGLHGLPHANNPPLGDDTGIGSLVDPSQIQPGIFSATFGDPRPQWGEKVFVRVFNAPTLEESLFYGESEVFTVDGYQQSIVVEVARTDRIIDYYLDTDGDGLPDWWEHLNYDGDRTAANPGDDDDGDGMTNDEEFQAGTGPHDENSFLGITLMQPVPLNDVIIGWQSVTGKVYQVQFTTNELSLVQYESIPGYITATGEITQLLVPEGLGPPVRHYRVRLIPDP